MLDILVSGIIFIILALAIGYIIKEKKAGAKCIGCSSSKSCASGSCKKHNEDT